MVYKKYYFMVHGDILLAFSASSCFIFAVSKIILVYYDFHHIYAGFVTLPIGNNNIVLNKLPVELTCCLGMWQHCEKKKSDGAGNMSSHMIRQAPSLAIIWRHQRQTIKL